MIEATTRAQVLTACREVGDDPETLVCFYVPLGDGEATWQVEDRAPVRCAFRDLPERVFDSGFGGQEGEPVICFSERHVYVRVNYDGSMWVAAVPRHPEGVERIPVLGGD
jgi:hypothetical protein